MLEELAGWAMSVVETLGYAGVALLVALENVFPPIPSEIVLPLAGFVASSGQASLVGMIAAATAGSLLGAYALYGMAAWVGPERLRRLVDRYGRWLALKDEDLNRAEAWFDRRASQAVLVCRCVPLMRSLISMPAGFRRMPLIPFTVYTAGGSLIWNVLLIGAGNVLGVSWRVAGRPVELLQGGVLLALGTAVAWFAWRRLITPRLGRPPGEI